MSGRVSGSPPVRITTAPGNAPATSPSRRRPRAVVSSAGWPCDLRLRAAVAARERARARQLPGDDERRAPGTKLCLRLDGRTEVVDTGHASAIQPARTASSPTRIDQSVDTAFAGEAC